MVRFDFGSITDTGRILKGDRTISKELGCQHVSDHDRPHFPGEEILRLPQKQLWPR